MSITTLLPSTPVIVPETGLKNFKVLSLSAVIGSSSAKAKEAMIKRQIIVSKVRLIYNPPGSQLDIKGHIFSQLYTITQTLNKDKED
jgi:hypothetical protein